MMVAAILSTALRMKFPVVLILASLGSGCLFDSAVESLAFHYYQLELRDGWQHRTEKAPADPYQGDLITIEGPARIGILQIQAYVAPTTVSKDILRNITNVDHSLDLAMQRWGDFSGFDYEYVEKKVSYRQWWLADDRTMIFITYQRPQDSPDVESDAIDTIVGSLRLNTP